MRKNIIITLLVILGLAALYFKQKGPEPTLEPLVILHTNDVHAGIDDHIGYAGLAAYKKKMEAQYGPENVILVDAGDAIQGASVAMLTKGEAIVELMNAVGYDYFTLGNHEFDYQIPRLFELAPKLESKIISSNFIDLAQNKSVYPPYEIYTVGNIDLAFVGVATPESLTKASTQYFQNETGEFAYTFLEDKTGQKLYTQVQKSIDKARKAGAEYVIGLVHLGLEEASAPWRSTDLIANVSGLDLVLDGHSHSVIEGEIHRDKLGQDVILAQTGTKLEYIGKVVIDPRFGESKDIVATLVDKSEAKDKDPALEDKIAEIKGEFTELLKKNVAFSEYDLITTVGDDLLARKGETNLGNLVADAYRTVLGTDLAVVNGGGIRANLAKGEITYEEIINLHPFGNYIISMEISGQTLKDALEMGISSYPAPNGGFLQVSGLSYDIDSSVPSSVKTDEHGDFLEITGAYRVKNIKINGNDLVENELYSIASSDFILKKGGDGLSMFKDSKILKDMFMADSEVLIKYIVENLNGKIGPDYADPNGSGRIKTIGKGDVPCCD